MSYQSILEGLNERFATVAGIKTVLPYSPKSVQETPLLFSLPDVCETHRSGQVKANEYKTNHYLVFTWQDPERATQEMLPFLDSVPAAVEADPHLGGRLPNGYAEIDEWEITWLDIANVTYLAIRFQSTAIER